MNLFRLGPFTLSSGEQSWWKLDLDALPDSDIATLAYLLAQKVGAFGSVEGIPRGGLRLALAMQRYVTPGRLLHVIVDDVLTTGRSMLRAQEEYQRRTGGIVTGLVAFARGECPRGVRALFHLEPMAPEAFWGLPVFDTPPEG